jgi:hypothetical protein
LPISAGSVVGSFVVSQTWFMRVGIENLSARAISVNALLGRLTLGNYAGVVKRTSDDLWVLGQRLPRTTVYELIRETQRPKLQRGLVRRADLDGYQGAADQARAERSEDATKCGWSCAPT